MCQREAIKQDRSEYAAEIRPLDAHYQMVLQPLPSYWCFTISPAFDRSCGCMNGTLYPSATVFHVLRVSRKKSNTNGISSSVFRRLQEGDVTNQISWRRQRCMVPGLVLSHYSKPLKFTIHST